MNERWVCKRCFADNEDVNSTCQRCGLIRGAEATPADQSAWNAGQATEETPKPQAGWQKWIKFAWIPVLVAVLVVGYLNSPRRGSEGGLENAAKISVTDLRVGDCFNAGEETEISDVDGVPCTHAHAYEVYHVADREASTFPTDDELDGIFADLCVANFQAYVGAPYETSEIYASMITPSEASFGDGDREYVCYLFDLADDALTSSQRGAAR